MVSPELPHLRLAITGGVPYFSRTASTGRIRTEPKAMIYGMLEEYGRSCGEIGRKLIAKRDQICAGMNNFNKN
jgi:hypothetical protein